MSAQTGCTVCNHPAREEIDEAIVGGNSYLSLERRYPPLRRFAIGRHAKHHISTSLVPIHRERRRDLRLLDRIEIVTERIEQMADSAHETGKANQLIAASRELRELYRLVGKVTGELDERPQVVNVLVDPTWLALRSGMLRVLEPYPEARAALATYLEQQAPAQVRRALPA